jgi:RNA recognition motif-containing protein
MNEGYEMIPLPEYDLLRITSNMEEGREPKFVGDMKLYVGNIAFGCTEKDIYDTFSEFGEVGDVALVRDDEGRNRGFGFVTMRTREGGEAAMGKLDGADVQGRNIAVRESNN